MEERMYNLSDLEKLVMEFKRYLELKGLSKGAIDNYLSVIKSHFNRGFSLNDLLGKTYEIIQTCFYKKNQYSKDHGREKSALFHFMEFILSKEGYNTFNISYSTGWSSFVPKDVHVSGYTVDDNCICVARKKFFNNNGSMFQKMKRIDVLMLKTFIRRHSHFLSPSNNAIKTIHGTLASYTYMIAGRNGKECRHLFWTNDEYYAEHVESIMSKYREIIDIIIKKVK